MIRLENILEAIGADIHRLCENLALILTRRQDREGVVKDVQKSRTKFPDDFNLTEERERYARGVGVSQPMKVFAHFKQHHQAKGSIMLSWEKAWQTWCLRHTGYKSKW